MTFRFNAVTVFCDTAREEKSGATSLVGVITDNFGAPEYPLLMPRLTVHTRIILAHDVSPIEPITVTLSDGQNETPMGSFSIEDIQRAIAGSVPYGGKDVTLISTATTFNLQLPQPMRLNIEVSSPSQRERTGTLNFMLRDSTASPPPS